MIGSGPWGAGPLTLAFYAAIMARVYRATVSLEVGDAMDVNKGLLCHLTACCAACSPQASPWHDVGGAGRAGTLERDKEHT